MVQQFRNLVCLLHVPTEKLRLVALKAVSRLIFSSSHCRCPKQKLCKIERAGGCPTKRFMHVATVNFLDRLRVSVLALSVEP